MQNAPEAIPKRHHAKWLRIAILSVILAYISLYSYNMLQNSKRYDYHRLSENMAISTENSKSGYVDDKGKLVINRQFDKAFPFVDGRAITGMKFGSQMKYRLIDKKGQYIGEFYDEIIEIGNQNYKVRNNLNTNKPEKNEDFVWQLMNSSGQIISKRDYNLIDPFIEAKARICIRNQCGFIDPQGNETIALSENFNQNVSQRVALVRDNNYTNYPQEMPYFSEGLLVIHKGKLLGYSNTQGKTVIEPQFLQAENFSSGVAVVRNEQGLGVIDKQGKFIIQPDPSIQKIDNFSENRATFTQNGYQGVMDNTGKIIVPISAKYQSIGRYQQGLARFNLNNLYGFIDTQGSVIIPPIYKQLGDFINGKAGVIKPDNPSEMIFIDKHNQIVGKSSVRMPQE